MTPKRIKAIFDSNVWISFLIGKRLSGLKRLIVDGQIKIITTPTAYFRNQSTNKKRED